MEQDGQAWVWDELGQRVVGLTRRTPRAQVRTTSLLHYNGDLEEGSKSKRWVAALPCGVPALRWLGQVRPRGQRSVHAQAAHRRPELGSLRKSPGHAERGVHKA